jgi:hypothetical protein
MSAAFKTNRIMLLAHNLENCRNHEIKGGKIFLFRLPPRWLRRNASKFLIFTDRPRMTKTSKTGITTGK